MSEYGYKWVIAMEQFAKSAQQAAQMLRETFPEPVKAEQPYRFKHRDVDGDRVLVYPHGYPEFESVLMVETDSDSVLLSQNAVNGLAQYLDQYRTDQTECDVELAEQCGRSTLRDDAAAIDGTPSAQCTCHRHTHHQPYGPVCLVSGCYCRGDHA